jgi:catechol 2,3-dioxygenase
MDTAGPGAQSADAMAHGIRPPGYRLPETTRLGRVRLQVADLERSLGYYRDLLGFRVLRQDTASVSLGPVGEDVPLIELRERREASPVPRRGRLGLFHFAILLPDRASLGRLLTHLGRAGAHAGMSDHLVSEAIYLTDPDGLGIEVYSDRPRSTWKHRGTELQMSTLPLNVADVVSSSGGAPWEGMPAGTRIGHVHLHVGGLEEAKAFYHAALGLDVTVWSYPGALFMSAGGYHHHLGTNTWATGATRAKDGDARLLEWEVLLPEGEPERAAESLRAAGYSVERSDRGWRAVDPWGTAVTLVSDRLT